MLAKFVFGPAAAPRRRSYPGGGPVERAYDLPCICNLHIDAVPMGQSIRRRDGEAELVLWHKCREQQAWDYITLHDVSGNTLGPRPGQQAAHQHPQGPRAQAAAAGPSSAQVPAAGAGQPGPQPMPQPGPSVGRHNTVPGPFVQPVSAPAAPQSGQQYQMPFAQEMPRQHRHHHHRHHPHHQVPFAQGTPGHQQHQQHQMPFAQGMGYTQGMPSPGGYGGGQGMPPAGEYGGVYNYDVPVPGGYGGDEMPVYEGMPSGGGYGEASGFRGPTGSGGGFARPPPPPSEAVSEARSEWVETRPENLYHSEETNSPGPNPHYKALPPVWGCTEYSKYSSH